MTPRELRLRLEAASEEYDRKAAVPVIGLLYSWPAWNRYCLAFREWDRAEAIYWARKADAFPAPSDGATSREGDAK